MDSCPCPGVGRGCFLGALVGRLGRVGQLGRTDARDVHVKPFEHRRVFHETVDQAVITRHRPGRYLDLLMVERSVVCKEKPDGSELVAQFAAPSSSPTMRSTTLLIASNSSQRDTRTLLPSPLLTKIVGAQAHVGADDVGMAVAVETVGEVLYVETDRGRIVLEGTRRRA